MKNSLLICAAVVLFSAAANCDVIYGEKTAGESRTGRYKEKLVDSEGSLIMEFWARVPQSLPSRPHLGIIFSFYGVGGGKGDNWDQGNAPHHIRELGWTDHYIFVSPRSKGAGWRQAADAEPLTKLIEWFLLNYPVDPRKVYLYGFSSGGFFIGPYATAHEDTIAGAFCVAGNVTGLEKTRNAADKGQEFYLVCGTNDGHKGASRKSRDRLRSMGYRYIYREIEGRTHTDIQGHDPSMKDGFTWLHALRHKSMPLSGEDQGLVDGFLSAKSVTELWNKPETAREIARIGGPQAAPVLVKALESGDTSTVKMAATVCSQVMFDSNAVKALAAAFAKNQPEETRRALVEALTFCANYRFEDAQTTLCRTALNKKAPAGLRIEAINAIGKAVEMQMLGNFDDRLMFETLFLCMMDKDEPVRRAAFDRLSRAVEGGYGFDPGGKLKTRKNLFALHQWEQWLNANCGKPNQYRRR